eukprot:COSAG02_NODE_2700_length_8207_cov_2.292057_5_plen_62_part_00
MKKQGSIGYRLFIGVECAADSTQCRLLSDNTIKVARAFFGVLDFVNKHMQTGTIICMHLPI